MKITLLRGMDYVGEFHMSDDESKIFVTNSNVEIKDDTEFVEKTVFANCIIYNEDNTNPIYTDKEGKVLKGGDNIHDFTKVKWENEYLKEEVERLKDKLMNYESK
jgi:hypothetical protein